MDAPFVLKMGDRSILKQDMDEAICLLKQDRDEGMALIFCWRYHLDGEQGLKLEKAGLCFLQHLTLDSDMSKLLTLAQILKPQMHKFRTKIDCMQAAQSASSSVSELQVATKSGY